MALVCDIKSDVANEAPVEPPVEQPNADLEDGEIEDDDDDTGNVETAPAAETAVAQPPVVVPVKAPEPKPQPHENKFYGEKRVEKRKYEKKQHLTEAEKHVMHLHKLERLEREKREKYRREQGAEHLVVDDFASNIEKAIANALKKDRMNSEEEREDEKRGRKRKKKEKDKRKFKQRKTMAEAAKAPAEDVDENEMLNMRSGSPERNPANNSKETSPTAEDYDSYDSEYSSDRSREDKREKRKEGNYSRKGAKGKKERGRDRERKYNRERNREQWAEAQAKDNANLCLFYLQGKCSKGDECPYSHGAVTPLKLELCKFYLTDCCAKGDKCLYMHSDFPCKFYHTGLTCTAGDNCKFAHGKALSEGLRQILYKHIETAPREILGGFPRMSREEALNVIAQTQKSLEVKYGESASDDNGSIPSLFDINVSIPSSDVGKEDKKDKSETKRNRPSRWQDPDPSDPVKLDPKTFTFSLKGFYSEQDQDLRVNSNGDIDMRTLTMPPPPHISQQPPPPMKMDVDIRAPFDGNVKQDVDIRPVFEDGAEMKTEGSAGSENVEFLPKKQRELYLRIQAQQKDNVVEYQKEGSDNEDKNIDWYSDDDDDDDNRLTIKDDEDVKEKGEDMTEEANSVALDQPPNTPQIKPGEVIEKLGDLSKIDISAEVTRLLSTMAQSSTTSFSPEPSKPQSAPPRDPRQAAQQTQPKAQPLADPRRARPSSTETRPKISIYEQGSISVAQDAAKDVDLRALEKDAPSFGDTDLRSAPVGVGGRPDIDLRNLGLQFKAIQNYTPATEIDATIASHPPMAWRVREVDVPRPDYTGLKLSAQDAHATGDPRLRKIFRLSVDEKDSPASPKQSPKAHVSTPVRVDPRRRKAEEKLADVQGMSYTQQLNVLQSSAFYQSLTSNQKVLLNQELSMRADQSGNHDPILNGILTNLGLITGPSGPSGAPNANVSALSILANVNNLSNPLGNVLGHTANANLLGAAQNLVAPVSHTGGILAQNPNLMNQMAQSIAQPGLLGAAPGIPNLPPDFPINFDPRNGGLLGNAPPPPYGPFQGDDNYNFANDDFYPEGNNFGGNNHHHPRGGGNRGFNRDHRPRRGRNNYNRNNGGRKFRTGNRNNRNHSSP